MPPGHRLIAFACNNLALTVRDLAHYVEAQELFEEVRRIHQRLYPEDHREVAIWLNNIAGVEKDLGLAEEAVERYRQALSMKRRLAGDFGPASLALSAKNLGTGWLAAGELDEAGAAFDEALAELARLEEPDPGLLAGVEHQAPGSCSAGLSTPGSPSMGTCL